MDTKLRKKTAENIITVLSIAITCGDIFWFIALFCNYKSSPEDNSCYNIFFFFNPPSKIHFRQNNVSFLELGNSPLHFAKLSADTRTSQRHNHRVKKKQLSNANWYDWGESFLRSEMHPRFSHHPCFREAKVTLNLEKNIFILKIKYGFLNCECL